ncbi:glycoside hydrolase family 16 protein [Peloplasma aerotolerans]|uniref:Glycoside hydrolase family 16 protein n=1 Tax=Peloplasma aerotolerans TaxID=3044389 RepID=A0AAW6U5A6_9MOLU|nr:glycoside hydrolase family 16 protein [Mariniplasma sp. M4Ah]MDI6453156.1 glycoside hydrolase family 16 protein [Mariniplasma sp. M4Ah]
MKYKLLWEDQFSIDGKPDEKIWNVEVGGTGFGNNESQFYVDDSKNVFVKDGVLNIVAYKEKHEHREYTSAKLTTLNKKSIQYGRVEIMAKIPEGKGTWPAIWFLGENKKESGWPLCGEIDLMEHVGKDPKHIHFSLHSKAYNHRLHNHPTFIAYQEDIFNGFHEYAMEWTENDITFYIDQAKYVTFTKQENATIEQWPFNQNFYLILNLAIGGNWGGAIDDLIFPVSMQIKYVKIYEKSE